MAGSAAGIEVDDIFVIIFRPSLSRLAGLSLRKNRPARQNLQADRLPPPVPALSLDLRAGMVMLIAAAERCLPRVPAGSGTCEKRTCCAFVFK